MLNYKGHALFSKSEAKKRDTLNIESDESDNAEYPTISFHDVNPRDNIVDPGTNRSVTGVNWTLYNGATVTHGQNGVLGYDANYPFNNLVFEVPGVMKVAQIGAPVLVGDYFKLSFQVQIL